MKQFLIIVLCIGLVGLSGCDSKSAEQLTQQKKERGAPSMFGDGNEPMPTPGHNIGGL